MADNLGTIIPQGNFLRINNAFVEEVSNFNRNSGFILISYSTTHPNGITTIDTLRLNVTNNTIIRNTLGLPICFCDIRPGMWIDTTFSSAMTRSIPPQANAFTITTRRTPQPPANTTTGRIAWVDLNNNMLYTGMPNNFSRQMRFVVTNNTLIQNRNGFPISLRFLRPGQLVRITHSNFMTASIPPQSTAFRIELL